MTTKNRTTEVVPVKMQKGRSGPDLAPVAKKIGEEFEQWKMAKRDAAFRGIRLGILLAHAKEQLAHGEFLPWLAETQPDITARSAQLFMKDAAAAMEDKALRGIGNLLIGDGSKKEIGKAEQALMKFIDGRTQQELREDLHAPGKAVQRDQQQRQQFDLKTECLVNLRAACDQVIQICGELDKPRVDTACTRLLNTLEALTGCPWRPDAEAKSDSVPFKEHGHVYER